jgi:hypothetical protein
VAPLQADIIIVQAWPECPEDALEMNLAVDRVLAEYRLVLGQPEAPQPIADIHGGPRFFNRHHHSPGMDGCPENALEMAGGLGCAAISF